MIIKNKINIFILVFSLVTVALIFILTGPFLNNIKESSKKFSEQKIQISLIEKRIENVEKFKKTYKEKESNFKQIESLFVNEFVPIDFIDFIEKTADGLGLLYEISPDPIVKNEKNKWSSLVFKIKLTGSFSNFMKFLEKIENSPYLIKIQDFNITSQAEGKANIGKVVSADDVEGIISIEVFTDR